MPIENIHQLIAWRPPRQDPIIEAGILLPETRCFIFGAAKTWKSMLSQYTAFAIASGNDWFGYSTQTTTVLKYQAELPKAIDRDRVIKFARAADLYPDNLFFNTPEDRVKLDTSWGIQGLQRDIEAVMNRCPDTRLVVILDPLYRLVAGHISDEYDVKKFQDNLDDLKNKLKFSIILIHHSRLTKTDSAGEVVDLGAEETMGSSYWNNWCDTMLRTKLLNPFTTKDKVEINFFLTRNSQHIVPDIEVQWNRLNLQPNIVKTHKMETEDITVQGLIGSK